MRRPKLTMKRALPWRIIVTLLLVAAGIWLLAANWHTVSAALSVARHADITWLALSFVLMVLTFCVAAATYGVLALHPLVYTQTLLVELATAFANRLLPAGLGGLGLNGIYLYRRKHTPAEATAVVSVNNLIGMLGHLLLLAGVLIFEPHVVRSLFLGSHAKLPWQLGLVILAVLLAASAVPAVRTHLAQFGLNIAKSVRKENARSLFLAVALAMSLTAMYTLVLLSAARSIGVDLSVLQTFIVFSVGMLVGTATPTPGGLVGVEAGLYASFVAYGVSNADAAAAVLLFRLITYWLPILPGAGALVLARDRKVL